MRTTLDIDEDVLMAVRELAQQRRTSLGRVVSDLARQGLVRGRETRERNGIVLFPVDPGAGVAHSSS
jgi:hypothetical protein